MKVTPRHNAFLDAIIESPIHVIATVRGKDEVVLEEVNGKQIPKKVGIGYDQRSNLEFLFNVSFNIDRDTHVASEFKDNTHLFEGKARILTEKDGMALYDWASNGSDEEIQKRADAVNESKEIGKQLMKESEAEEAVKLENSPQRKRQQKATPEVAEEVPFEMEDKPKVVQKAEAEPDVIDDDVDAYEVWREAYASAKKRGLNVAQVKAIISDSGTESPKKDTPKDVLLKAVVLLNQA